ncbi:LacI family DNA-binding transcriptional regulator [Vagococcus sp.]|uniref:LacI family DNA-binding transcriptional regulator n=1 Tax=Vagococcus sp. TaxID=1933889 RepID=UPI003F9620E9
MAGIRDVAKRASVSIATVSRFLNHDATLSIQEDTKTRIMESVTYFDYALPKKKSKRLKEVTLLVAVSEMDELNDPYFRSIRLGVEKETERMGLKITEIIRLDRPFEVANLKQETGVIVIGEVTSQVINAILKRQIPIVMVDDASYSEEYDSVVADFERATQAHLDRLYASGHRQIAFIGGARLLKNGDALVERKERDIREKTYQDWMLIHELEPQTLIGDWSTLEGMRLAEELIAKTKTTGIPSAIVVGSDPMAVGVYRAIQKNNLKIPEDISVVSFDNIEVVEFLTPPLTTVNIESEELGKIAVRLMNERLEGIRHVSVRIKVPGEIILRESEK